MKKLLLFAALVAAAPSWGKVAMTSIFSDSMVLQRQCDAAIWGRATPGATVTVAPSWSKKPSTFTAGEDGKWQGTIATPKAGGPYKITIGDGDREEVVISQVMSGEVWYMSGQSNMQFRMSGVRGFAKEQQDALYPSIRLFTAKIISSLAPAEDVIDGKWVCAPTNLATWSAVGFLFARDLYKEFKVPVGIIQTARGGSAQEAWLDEGNVADKPAMMKLTQQFRDGTKPVGGDGDGKYATGLYNGLVAPIKPYTIKGVGWYQGEANIAYPKIYAELLERFIAQCRRDWNNPDLPFIMAQISGFKSKDNPGWWDVQRVQYEASLNIPNVATVMTYDAGDEKDIHPKWKQPVAERMFLAARKLAYGERSLTIQGPSLVEWKATGDGKAVVTFRDCGKGLVVKGGGAVNNFEVSADGKDFVAAKAVVTSPTTVEVSAEGMKDIAAVRYAAYNFNPDVNLYSSYDLPVVPFR